MNTLKNTILILVSIFLVLESIILIEANSQINELSSALRGCQKYVYHIEELAISEYALGRLKSTQKQPFIYRLADRHPKLKRMIIQLDSLKEKYPKIPPPSDLPDIK